MTLLLRNRGLIRKVSGDTPAANEFVTRWNVPGGSFTFPAGNTGTYSAEIKFGDQTDWLPVVAYNDANLTQTLTAGVLDIRVRGTFPYFFINNGSVRTYITEVVQWGDVGFQTMQLSFYGASNFNTLPSGPITGISSVVTMQDCFRDTAIPSIPSGFLDQAVNTTNFVRTFQNTPITTFVDTLLQNCTGTINVNSMFRLCGSLNVDISNFWTYFIYSPCVLTFGSCTSMTGPSGTPWLNVNSNPSYTLTAPNYDSGVPNGLDCFAGSVNFSDYASIPTYWK